MSLWQLVRSMSINSTKDSIAWTHNKKYINISIRMNNFTILSKSSLCAFQLLTTLSFFQGNKTWTKERSKTLASLKHSVQMSQFILLFCLLLNAHHTHHWLYGNTVIVKTYTRCLKCLNTFIIISHYKYICVSNKTNFPKYILGFKSLFLNWSIECFEKFKNENENKNSF